MSRDDIVIRLRFASIAERDEFIDLHFPRRKCLDFPGAFDVGAWGSFVVFCELVTLFPDAAVVRKGLRP